MTNFGFKFTSSLCTKIKFSLERIFYKKEDQVIPYLTRHTSWYIKMVKRMLRNFKDEDKMEEELRRMSKDGNRKERCSP